MMTTFESSVKRLNIARKPVFGFLSDIKNLESLIPEDKVRNFEAEKDICHFTVDGLGNIGVKLASAQPDGNILFESEGSNPVRFDLRIDLDEQDAQSTTLKLTLRAELNMMMRMMVSGPVEQGLEMIASKLEEHINSRNWD